MYIFIKVLQNLRYHLAGGGRICFNIREHRIFNYFAALPVVVKYHNCFGFAQEPRALCVIGAVGVHYHHYTPVICHFHGLLPMEEHVRRVAFFLCKTFFHRPQGGGNLVQDNMGFLPQHLRRAENAHGCPKRIHIADAVPHNEHFFPALNNFPQCMGFHPCLHPRHFLYLTGFAAKIGDFLSFLHYDLVAAPAQGKVNGHP